MYQAVDYLLKYQILDLVNVPSSRTPSFVPSSVPSDVQSRTLSFASPLYQSGLPNITPSSVLSNVPLNMLSTFHTIPSYGTSQGPSDGPNDRL